MKAADSIRAGDSGRVPVPPADFTEEDSAVATAVAAEGTVKRGPTALRDARV